MSVILDDGKFMIDQEGQEDVGQEANFRDDRQPAPDTDDTASLPDENGSWLVSTLSGWWSSVYDLPYWARELIRKALHIGVVVLALPLRWFGWWYGIAFAAVSFVWNAVGMPRYFKFTFRDDEKQTGYSRGMLSYPITVLVLIIFFPLPIAASQWATLSFGDGFATLIGKFFGKTPLRWNKDKTYEGMSAFLVMGTLGSFFFFVFTLGNAEGSSFLWQSSWVLLHIQSLSIPMIAFICFASTMVAAIFESLPFYFIDDNIIAPVAGALAKLGLCFLL
ncbi:MAG: hypothetical protein R6V10_05650 [bacterium]